MTKPRLAILGGTFDPVHKAHLACALYVQQLLQPEQVQLMPCHLPAHRSSPGVSPEHRAAMVKLAIAPHPGLSLQTLELDQHRPSYTADSLQQLALLYPQHQLLFVMGSDSLAYFKSWKKWQSILELSHLVVCQRPGSGRTDGDCAALLDQFGVATPKQLAVQQSGAILWLDNAPMDLSASQIRQLLQSPQPELAAPLLDSRVLDYIRQHQLYQAM
ncbi:nicotinate-nucleotide adenylyltransferase [Rheinheimera marina]|uniref:Probable nicotinate-nucleotide adenylyltransferase n=1 Tax=Rheinheimera marina TaxID=1774958 RepID=A0ABV9JLF5_9GAMM